MVEVSGAASLSSELKNANQRRSEKPIDQGSEQHLFSVTCQFYLEESPQPLICGMAISFISAVERTNCWFLGIIISMYAIYRAIS
jgi:hypothetical protein